MTEMRITKYPEQFKKIAEEMAVVYGPEFHGCSQVVAGTLMEILGVSDELVLKAASFFCRRIKTMFDLRGDIRGFDSSWCKVWTR